MKKEYKRTILYSILRLALFAAVFAVSFLCLEKLFYSDAKEHPVWKYAVNEEHAPIDVLFLGNSHVYSSVDAKMLSDATGLNIRDLTCASANGENVVADLEAFLQYEVPKVVVVEICPFGTRQDNYEEMRSEKLGILFDHLDGIPDFGIHLKAVSKIAPFEDVPAGVFQLLRSGMMWERWCFDKKESRAFDEYGAHKLFDVDFDTRYLPELVTKAYLMPSEGGERLIKQNEEAFLKVVELAERYGFELWFYNAPTQFYNQKYNNLLRMAESLRAEHPCIRYIDNSMLYLTELGIGKTDYYDEYHLNLDGMEKVSLWLGELISERFHTRFDVDSLLQYKGCAVRMLENGNYRYEYETICPGRHKFTYTKGGVEYDTGLTAQNWFEEGALSGEEIGTLYVTSQSLEEEASGTVKHRFLPFTIEGYSAQRKDGGVSLKNESNFADDLVFGWVVVNKSNGALEVYDYKLYNEVSIAFSESGTYEIRALTRQLSDGVTRETTVLTATYDAGERTVVTAVPTGVPCTVTELLQAK